MSFDSKLETFFSSVTIHLSSKYPKHHVHLYADYIEILSLFSNNNFVSTSDILDRFRDERIISQISNDEDQAEENDKSESWINEIYRVLSDRNYLYDSDYPFEIENSNRIILKEENLLNDRHKLYLSMLLSSNLYLFKDFLSELTKEFELISFYALKSFLPIHAKVKSFGENSDYSGTAIEKIEKLAEDLKVTINEEYVNKISPLGTQERGLDLVGWISFEDMVSNFLSIFCQCACGSEWYKKLNETRRYENYYKFNCNKPQHAVFIPYSLINFQNSDFYQGDELIDTLLFERKRILFYLRGIDFFNDCDSKTLVEKCITFEEDIV